MTLLVQVLVLFAMCQAIHGKVVCQNDGKYGGRGHLGFFNITRNSVVHANPDTTGTIVLADADLSIWYFPCTSKYMNITSADQKQIHKTGGAGAKDDAYGNYGKLVLATSSSRPSITASSTCIQARFLDATKQEAIMGIRSCSFTDDASQEGSFFAFGGYLPYIDYDIEMFRLIPSPSSGYPLSYKLKGPGFRFEPQGKKQAIHAVWQEQYSSVLVLDNAQ